MSTNGKKTSEENAAGALSGNEIVRIARAGGNLQTTTATIAALATRWYGQRVWIEEAPVGNDTTGQVGNSAFPFATLDAALMATAGPTILHIGAGVFASPTHDLLGGAVNAASKLRANLVFMGSGRPALDSYGGPDTDEGAPTQLVGGTILVGSFVVNGIDTRNGFQLHNLGVDCGSARTNADQDCFAIFNIGQVVPQQPIRGVVVDNVITLARSATALAHAWCFENAVDPQVTRIESYFGYHGFAWKCVGGYVDGLISRGHAGDVMIVKESNFGNTSAPCNNTRLTNVTGGALMAGDTPVGVILESSGPNWLDRVTLDGVKLMGVSTTDLQLTVDGSSTAGLRNLRINDFSTDAGSPRISMAGTTSSIDQTSIILNGKRLNNELTLTDGSTIDTDCSKADNFRVVLGGNRMLDNPSNMTGGDVYNWRIIQDATGGRTLTFGSAFKFAGGAPTLSTGAGAVDLISCQYSATDGTLACALAKGEA